MRSHLLTSRIPPALPTPPRHASRFPGHPESVQALVAFDDDTLLTGSSDGAVRVVGVLPNRLLGILGQHNGVSGAAPAHGHVAAGWENPRLNQTRLTCVCCVQ